MGAKQPRRAPFSGDTAATTVLLGLIGLAAVSALVGGIFACLLIYGQNPHA